MVSDQMDLEVSRNILLGNGNTYLREGRGEKSFTSTFLLNKKLVYEFNRSK